MKHEALKELLSILKTPDWTDFCPEKVREEKLHMWIEKWIVEEEFTQDVVNTKYLTSEYNDLIKVKLAQSMAEDLAEDCVTYNTSNKKVTATMCAFRRKAK